jgi:hypothetical protein
MMMRGMWIWDIVGVLLIVLLIIVIATPLIPFFYKTYLFEVGYSSNQHIMVNWTIQF